MQCGRVIPPLVSVAHVSIVRHFARADCRPPVQVLIRNGQLGVFSDALGYKTQLANSNSVEPSCDNSERAENDCPHTRNGYLHRQGEDAFVCLRLEIAP